MTEHEPMSQPSPASDCVERFRIAFEYRQSVRQAEVSAYAYFDQLQGEENWRVEQRVAFERRMEREAAERLMQQHQLTSGEFAELLIEQTQIEALQLFSRYPPE